jgi:YesN/AraC family two-component response regulator
VKILSYIEENCEKKLTLDELANQFAYNRYYFSKFFNSYIGDSLTNYINNTRVRKFIKLYEISPDKSLLNLALSVGFDSMPSFYRAFNRVYHCTPKEYFKRTLKQ